MAYRNGNYSAFYVAEPFSESNLGAAQAKDFCYYNLLRAWKSGDSNFHFIDSHNKNYNVRDGSDWEKTLKPRLRERIRNSKNIILFLSSITKNSKALREEIEYGITDQSLPVLVIYPEFNSKSALFNGTILNKDAYALRDKLTIFRDTMSSVPVMHLPINKNIIKKALDNTRFMVNTKTSPGEYVCPDE